MPALTNQQLVQDYFRDPSADAFTADALLHDTSQPHPLRGRDSIRTFLRMFLQEAFPDGAYELHAVLADDRYAMAEWTFRGTNTGPVMEFPATGRRVEFSGVSVYEFEGRSISHARIYYDTGTLADQLGLTGGRIPLSERSHWTEWWAERR